MAVEAVSSSDAGAAQGRRELTFESLFVAHYAAVWRVLYRTCGDREEADDLAQETFLKLHRSPQLWTAPEPAARAWLYRVATNLAYNALRARRRRVRREEATAGFPDTDVAASDWAAAADARAAVRATLARLPERTAQLLLLREEGLSYRELADVIGVAPGSIGTLLARAAAEFEKRYLEVTEKAK